MIIPPTFFPAMVERAACHGSMQTGDPVAATDRRTRYIRSILEIKDARGQLVGWVYLADDEHGGDQAEYIQGNRKMSNSDLRATNIHATGSPLTSVSLLSNALPADLNTVACTK